MKSFFQESQESQRRYTNVLQQAIPVTSLLNIIREYLGQQQHATYIGHDGKWSRRCSHSRHCKKTQVESFLVLQNGNLCETVLFEGKWWRLNIWNTKDWTIEKRFLCGQTPVRHVHELSNGWLLAFSKANPWSHNEILVCWDTNGRMRFLVDTDDLPVPCSKSEHEHERKLKEGARKASLFRVHNVFSHPAPSLCFDVVFEKKGETVTYTFNPSKDDESLQYEVSMTRKTYAENKKQKEEEERLNSVSDFMTTYLQSDLVTVFPDFRIVTVNVHQELEIYEPLLF